VQPLLDIGRIERTPAHSDEWGLDAGHCEPKPLIEALCSMIRGNDGEHDGYAALDTLGDHVPHHGGPDSAALITG
jgi:hypothetical protein